MNNNHTDHPSEERLLEFALKGEPPDIERHVNGCLACAKAVKEFRYIKERVSSFGDEEVPASVERRILRITRHGRGGGGPFSGLQSFIFNPFFIALLVAIIVILLHFLVGSEVFKAP